MPPVGFELTISAGEWPQTHASDRAATGTSEHPSLLHAASWNQVPKIQVFGM